VGGDEGEGESIELYKAWRSIIVRSAARFWTNTPLSSAIDAENISVSILAGKKMPVQNLTPIISVTIIAWLAWIICFFAEIAAGTEREEVVFHFSIISVKNARPIE
jgi:hypothetical protein